MRPSRCCIGNVNFDRVRNYIYSFSRPTFVASNADNSRWCFDCIQVVVTMSSQRVKRPGVRVSAAMHMGRHSHEYGLNMLFWYTASVPPGGKRMTVTSQRTSAGSDRSGIVVVCHRMAPIQ